MVVSWWSGGLTSAVACKIALQKYNDVKVVYIETGSHHPDTLRFKKDCEAWYGVEIHTIQNKKYDDHIDVVLSTRYVNGPGGARCTGELKKNVRFDFERSNDVTNQVWGYEFTTKEVNRAIRTIEQYGYTNPLFPLIEEKLTKNECAGLVQSAGIEIPEMYKLGYSNNNCVGCVKGGAGYWNKIRVDFPEVFKAMAEAEREINATCIKGKKFLDQLNPKAGRNTKPIISECGAFCQVNHAEIISPLVDKIMNGASIYQ